MNDFEIKDKLDFLDVFIKRLCGWGYLSCISLIIAKNIADPTLFSYSDIVLVIVLFASGILILDRVKY